MTGEWYKNSDWQKVIWMERKGKIALALCALAVLLAAGLSQLAYAATATTIGASGCEVFPVLRLGKTQLKSAPERVVVINITVKAVQAASCGPMTYGVDFTNGYDAEFFSLGIRGATDRNLFTLAPDQEKTFEGIIGVMPGTLMKNYTLQVTAYLDSDHWKQVSEKLNVMVSQEIGSDAQWKTGLQIGWNNVPYAEGTGIYGCQKITTAYRYSPYKGDYIVLNRYGPIFEPAPFEPSMPDERNGALFAFSTERCSLESRVPPEALEGPGVLTRGGQLLSIPPAWHGQKVGDIKDACEKQAGSAIGLDAKYWDAGNQRWMIAQDAMELWNGKVLRVSSGFGCLLDLSSPLSG